MRIVLHMTDRNMLASPITELRINHRHLRKIYTNVRFGHGNYQKLPMPQLLFNGGNYQRSHLLFVARHIRSYWLLASLISTPWVTIWPLRTPKVCTGRICVVTTTVGTLCVCVSIATPDSIQEVGTEARQRFVCLFHIHNWHHLLEQGINIWSLRHREMYLKF